MRFLFAALLNVLGLLLPVAGTAAGQQDTIRISGETMGTYYRVTIDSPPAFARTADIRTRIEDVLAEFNRQMSTWDPNSEISLFNRFDSMEWFPVSDDFALVLEEAQRIHRQTDGVLDPTVAPLIELWGFGSSRRREPPTDQEIQDALQRVGMQHIAVRRDPPAIRRMIPGVQLDLSAIAPGYANDLIAAVLDAADCRSWLVDIGGESRAGKEKSGGQPWKIGVESPHGGIYKIVDLVSQSVATSGDYRNFFEINGRRYSHALNPETGWPVENPPASVSILSDNSMTADALGTALMVMGTERGMQFAELLDLDVMFLDVDLDGTVRETSRGIFAAISPLPATGPEVEASGTDNDAAQGELDARPLTAQSAWWLPFVAAAGIFLLAMTGMSIGVLLRNRQLKGSCGGLASMPGNEGRSICELCTKPREDCINPEVRERLQAADEPRHE